MTQTEKDTNSTEPTKTTFSEHIPSQEDLSAHRKLHRPGSTISDVILGGQDGIVNVLGVVLGVAAASGNSRIIIAAALATTFAESL